MEFLETNFDIVFMIMILLGNFTLFNIVPYGKLLKMKKMKMLLTFIQSSLIGVGYFYLSRYEGGDDISSIRVLINSFLLASLVYEFGLKEVFEYLKTKGGSILVSIFKKKLGE